MPEHVNLPAQDAAAVDEFVRRVREALGLPAQESAVVEWLSRRASGTVTELATHLKVSSDTARRLLTHLMSRGVVESSGKGRATIYTWKGGAW